MIWKCVILYAFLLLVLSNAKELAVEFNEPLTAENLACITANFPLKHKQEVPSLRVHIFNTMSDEQLITSELEARCNITVLYAAEVKPLQRDPRHALRFGLMERLLEWASRDTGEALSGSAAEGDVVRRNMLYDKQRDMPASRSKTRAPAPLPDVAGGSWKDDNACPMVFSDKLFASQWYLVSRGQNGEPPGNDLNVCPAWRKGFSGRGVVVCVLDDGLLKRHPDLRQNFDAKASENLNQHGTDPSPDVGDNDNSHGTRCAGIIAASANNTHCGVGIAFNAKIGGVKMLDGKVTDVMEATAINHRLDHVHIYSASWGPFDDGETMESPGHFAAKALERGVKEGRNGLGAIYVWATGNGGYKGDSCAADGYVSSIYTLSIGSVNQLGLSTFFMEFCTSTMAVVFAGGAHNLREAEYDDSIKVVSTDVFLGTDGECTTDFQGTSAAAPLAAGCIALVLEANPQLTWRDVQHIVVQAARIPNGMEDVWTINGAGRHVSLKFGFGVLDCGRMVELAQDWVSVAEHRRCEIELALDSDEPQCDGRFIADARPLRLTLPCDGCGDDAARRIRRLEHVQLYVRLTGRFQRGDIRIVLYSPAGTPSLVLPLRPRDKHFGIDFTFTSVHSWDENPEGNWTVFIHHLGDVGHSHEHYACLEKISLTLYGTDAADPPPSNDFANDFWSFLVGNETALEFWARSHHASRADVWQLMADEERLGDNVRIDEPAPRAVA